MERSDWSRAFHHQGRHGSSPIIAPEALFCGNIVARGHYGSSVSTALIGREQSRHSFALILSLRGATGQVSTVLIGRDPLCDL